MNDIRLSIGLPKKQQPQQQPTKKRFTAAALIHQKQQLEQQQQQQQLLHQQDDDDEHQHETHHVFRIESPKGKQNVWWCHSMGCGSGRIVTIILLFVFTFAWLLTLTLLHAFSSSGSGGSSGISAIAPVIERNARDTLKFEVPFTLQPENNNNSRIMTIPLQSLTFERLIRYDVCCTHQAYFVCRSVLKNIGVEAYLTSEKNAVVVVIHPDMVGARCVIMWTERAI